MIETRKSEDRGRADHGWLISRHTFSFADYHDSRFMGFRNLRVINEDRVTPGRGFATHAHRDMEILTYVLDGALEHKDSMSNGSIVRPGDVQRMTAGTGVTHSEFNHSASGEVHFLQVWVVPEKPGEAPSYEQRSFSVEERRDVLRLVASRDGRDGSITLRQDVDLYAGLVSAGASVERPLAKGRHGWIQVAHGGVSVNGTVLVAGDGAAVSDESSLRVVAEADSELLFFDLA